MKKIISPIISLLVLSMCFSCDNGRKGLTEEQRDSLAKSMTDSLVQATIDSANASVNGAYDEEEIKRLSPFTRQKRDEFSDITWVFPKTAPYYNDQNGFYLYFQLNSDDRASNLRFRYQYTANDWLFIRQLKFLIDDKERFEYNPKEVKQDNGNGVIWEWIDESASLDAQWLYAIRNAKSVKIRIVGSQYHRDISLTKSQITDIDRMLSLYVAHGGL